MGRIFTVTTPNGEHDIDLGTIRDIWAPTRSAKWNIGRGSEYDDVSVDADTGAAIRAAWRAYHGTGTTAVHKALDALAATHPTEADLLRKAVTFKEPTP